MNKKGFTLVELLAVIAILAILAIIALPNVLRMLNDSRKNSFVNEVSTIHRIAGTQWMSDNITSASSTITYARLGGNPCKSGQTNLPTLDLEGSKSVNYVVTVTDGKVTTLKVDNGTLSYTKTSAVDRADIKASALDETYTKVVCPN